VGVAEGVTPGVGEAVGVGDETGVAVLAGVAVAAGLGVAVGDGLSVGVAVGVAVEPPVNVPGSAVGVFSGPSCAPSTCDCGTVAIGVAVGLESKSCTLAFPAWSCCSS
jgi:hypothetical protein